MEEAFCRGSTLPQVYHAALCELYFRGEDNECTDYSTMQKELSMTMVIDNPLKEPMISKLGIHSHESLQQYLMEMIDGILDFEIAKGNWKYTYHNRITWYHIAQDEWADQIEFVVDELKRNPSSRRAVIDVRYNYDDMYSSDPACLQHIQYFIRDNKLHCKVIFRSNDACKATFMNAFALIMLQKKIADELSIEVGSYTHRANSFHCYQKDYDTLRNYVNSILGSNPNDCLVYNYENDWKDIMEECIPDIINKVKKLKGED